MSAIVKSTKFNVSPAQANLSGDTKHSGNLFAGMALSGGDACYIDTGGKVFKSQDTGASAAQAQVHGYTPRSYSVNEACTLFHGIEVGYTDASGGTPGAKVFLSASVAGGLDTAASNSHAPCGHFVNDQLVYLRKLIY